MNRFPARKHIAHQGVHLGSTIAGENSLEALRLAGRAGFECVEMDVHLTVDGEFVVVHDTTLNRTFLRADGAELVEPVRVADLTLAQLEAGYVLRARDAEDRTRIPTLREYLEECRRIGILPFIELKLKDQARHVYDDLIALANGILGADGYILTSNNNLNTLIRSFGITDATLMGILYQTTFEEIEGLGNTIMAISLTKFSAEEHRDLCLRAAARGIITEAHADDFALYALADAHRIEYLSTDRLAPDLTPDAQIAFETTAAGFGDFAHHGVVDSGALRLASGHTLSLIGGGTKPEFGGVFLEIEMSGGCRVHLADQTFEITSPETAVFRHQVLFDEHAPAFTLTADDDCVIRSLRVRVAAY